LGREETVRGQPGTGAAFAQHEALVTQVRQGDAAALRQAMALQATSTSGLERKTWSSRSRSAGGMDMT
jgi:DNA-binding GntR family transcriptional regulator